MTVCVTVTHVEMIYGVVGVSIVIACTSRLSSSLASSEPVVASVVSWLVPVVAGLMSVVSWNVPVVA